MAAGGAAAIEALRAELALANEQARVSNAAALKAAEELKRRKDSRDGCEAEGRHRPV